MQQYVPLKSGILDSTPNTALTPLEYLIEMSGIHCYSAGAFPTTDRYIELLIHISPSYSKGILLSSQMCSSQTHQHLSSFQLLQCDWHSTGVGVWEQQATCRWSKQWLMREGQALQALQEAHGRLKQLEEQSHKLVMVVKGFHPLETEQEGKTGNFTFLKKKHIAP